MKTILVSVAGVPHVVQADVDEPALVTIPDVEIASVGTWPTAVSLHGDPGGTTFTEEDLAAAVAAQDDPAIRQPRLKLGHFSQWADAEPAFGTVTNMRLTENGQTLVGDFTGVPAWLEKVLPSVYPSRSVECSFFVTSSSGKRHQCVVTDLALLGVQLPAIGTLEDLAGIFSEEMPEGTEIVQAKTRTDAQTGGDMGILKRKAVASASVEDIRRAYYESLGGDQMWWWIRAVYLDPNELIVDDDEGTLYRVPFSLNGDEVTFSDAEEVKIQYVDASNPVAAGRAESVAYASRSESRPETQDKEDGVDSKEIRNILGLPEDATDDDVRAKLEATQVEPAPETPETETPQAEVETPAAEVAEPVAASDGTVPVDASALAQMQADAEMGRQARAQQLEEERERFLGEAVKAGKFAPARLEHWRGAYKADPEGAKAAIAGLAEGLIPVGEQGAIPGEDTKAAAYNQSWLSPAERERAGIQEGVSV